MSLLPNMRWLTKPSQFMGEDWREISLEIDQEMATTNLDLAEESVYLLFDHDPESVSRGEAMCKVARSVIGPKISPQLPLELLDWKAASVLVTRLNSMSWDKAFIEAAQIWKAHSTDYKVFILRIHRTLNPELDLSLEAIFAE